MKKMNLLKLCKVMFYILASLFSIVLVSASLIKINVKFQVKGIIRNEAGINVMEIQVLKSNMNELTINQNVILENEKGKIEVMVKNIEEYDIGLTEGNIIRYQMSIEQSDNKLFENQYYDFQLYSTNKISLFSYIYRNIK